MHCFDFCSVKSRTKRVLITDFGQAVNALKYTRAPRTGNTGTMAYCAPELLFPSSDNSYSDDYSCSSDMYSLGVVLYVMCFGAIPFCDDSLESLQRAFDNLNQRQFSFPTAFSRSKDVQDLIRKLVVIDPQNRLTIDELISDPILLRHDHLHRLLPFVPTSGNINASAQSDESSRYLRPWRPSFAASTSEIENISTQLVPLARASTSAPDTSASIFPLVVSSPQVAPTIHQISTHSTPRHAASALKKVTPVNDSLLLSHINSREAPPPLLLDAISSIPCTDSAVKSTSVITSTGITLFKIIVCPFFYFYFSVSNLQLIRMMQVIANFSWSISL
jgi:serine/threonine protein kinase